MKLETAQKLLEQGKQTYEVIAWDFSRTRQNLWAILSLFEPYVNNGDNILDIGCGNGRLIGLLKNKKIDYLGVDNSENLIKLARQDYPEYNFKIGDITAPELGNQEFDKIFLIGVLHHIPSRELRNKCVQNIYAALKPGGHVFMTNWNLWQKKFRKYHFKYTLKRIIKQCDFEKGDILKPWGKIGKSRYLHGFTQGELSRLAKQNNFKILKNYYVAKDGAQASWRDGWNIMNIWQK
ncbi:methyltransferase domain-containing protein [Patescibacteria group bacterium]|nr:methyltransferase domain-containing protein [Patescibacteria group bacterium]MBU1921992.1 methyltransferase domain-containing protein [Patescibacteria group bacterium]